SGQEGCHARGRTRVCELLKNRANRAVWEDLDGEGSRPNLCRKLQKQHHDPAGGIRQAGLLLLREIDGDSTRLVGDDGRDDLALAELRVLEDDFTNAEWNGEVRQRRLADL